MRSMITTQNNSKAILAENLQRIFAKRGFGSKKEVAEKLGWTQGRISKLCNPQFASHPDLKTLDLLADALDVETVDLIRPAA